MSRIMLCANAPQGLSFLSLKLMSFCLKKPFKKVLGEQVGDVVASDTMRRIEGSQLLALSFGYNNLQEQSLLRI